MHEIIDFIVQTVGDLGYLGIFIMMLIESTIFPFPSELAMIPAGYLVSIKQMSFTLALFFGTLGAIIGSSINYFLGYHFGGKVIKKTIEKYGKYILLKEEHYEKSNHFFKKHGHIATFMGRLVPVVRHLISIPAGVFKMNFGQFLFYTGLGAGVWNIALIAIGYIAGENQELIGKYSKELLFGIIIFILIVGCVYYLVNKKK